MEFAELPHDESERLASLRRLAILDTDAEAAYDELTQLATAIAGTEIALVSLVDEHRTWFKSHTGIDASEMPRQLAMCSFAILKPDETFVVNDALVDPRFADSPVVIDGPRMRFYTGVVLRSPVDAMPLGTLCVISQRPMSLLPAQSSQLRMLAHQVERLLSLHLLNRDLVRHALSLEAARAESERASTAKSHFLATVSHDMRTPLSGLVGTLDLLEDELTTAPQRDLLATANACSTALQGLVNDTLDLARIESGALQLVSAPFSPVALVDDSARVIRAILKAKSPDTSSNSPVELVVQQDPSLPSALLGDAPRCQQVLMNLLGNAAKFTRSGRITLTSQWISGLWHVTVSDTGPGIAPDDLGSIFEPFVQTDAGRTSSTGGAGLGLSICRRLCRLMDGEVKATSVLGSGSTFTATMQLPIAQDEAHRRATPSPALPLRSLRILLAEDNRISRRVAAAQLEKLGMTVTAVDGGLEALRALREGAFDLALLDVYMPDMQGPDATKAFRATEAPNQHLPIIGLTASELPEDRARCLGAGMDDVVTKPLRRTALMALLGQSQTSLMDP